MDRGRFGSEATHLRRDADGSCRVEFPRRGNFDDFLSPRQSGMMFPTEASADAIARKKTPIFVVIAFLGTRKYHRIDKGLIPDIVFGSDLVCEIAITAGQTSFKRRPPRLRLGALRTAKRDLATWSLDLSAVVSFQLSILMCLIFCRIIFSEDVSFHSRGDAFPPPSQQTRKIC